ncbi:MAG: 16S rRNA (cytosine(1402)-N(4))-methyltransferase RsmH [Candidatus Komeilibacteria bacterium]|nr:16S rRNA (cytosine(1402)-N(4))-methyltransferase RsmH [Candidatus Komeilibacteria bacterium]
MEALIHEPVLLAEVLQITNLQPGDQVIDCTLGLAGHAQAFLEKIGPAGKFLGLDWDNRSLEQARAILDPYAGQAHLVNASFADLLSVVKQEKIFNQVKLIFFDLGWSSWQLLQKPGFSFQRPEDELDLRFDESSGQTAADLLNNWSAEDLARIFKEYGQEAKSIRLAQEIVLSRKAQPIQKVGDLLSVVGRIIPRRGKIHPATKIWQALRIAVNQELEILPKALQNAWQVL